MALREAEVLAQLLVLGSRAEPVGGGVGVEPADAEALTLRVPLPRVPEAMPEFELIIEGLRAELADMLAEALCVAA